MTVYKSKNGKWFTKFRYKNYNGTTKWVTKRGFDTKRDAARWESDFKQRQAGSPDMRFEDFVEAYKRDCLPRIRESTMVTKINIIDTKILPFFTGRKLREIRPADVLRWQNELLTETTEAGKPYSPAYLKTIHGQLSSIFNHAVRFYGLRENPARAAGSIGSGGSKMSFWTPEQYQAFADSVKDDRMTFCCFELLYWTGIRKGELLALTREDIDLDAKTLTVNKTFHCRQGTPYSGEPKTRKGNRTIVLPQFLCDELRDYFSRIYDLAPTDRLFPVGEDFLNRKLKNGCAKACLPPIRVHDFRHSHISLLIHLGYSAVAIAERAGHETAEITCRYAHVFPTVQTRMGQDLNSVREAGLAA